MTPQVQQITTEVIKNPLACIVQPNDFPLQSKTYEFCQEYMSLPSQQRIEMLKELAVKYEFDRDATRKAAESYLTSHDKGTASQLKAADRLKSTLSPNYAYAFNRIRKIDGGVKFLVDLREDLLKFLPSLDYNDDATHHLKGLNNYLKEILSFSFNIGFLNVERITWDSSCNMLEKISLYEAVHPIRNWTDIKQRVGPYRRCYIFTHNSMPKEPIVVLHTALTNEISSCVKPFVRQDRKHLNDKVISQSKCEKEDPNNIQAAIFYSITSTQKGLHGIELGNQLIKKAVQEVLSEFPHVSKFSSLSPIPGFRDWLLLEIRKLKNGTSIITSFFSEQDIQNVRSIISNVTSSEVWNALNVAIASNKWIVNEQLREALQLPLMKTCAHYLYKEKRRNNALNSVAHFHLRNGAVLWRLNWEADLSPRGLDNSCGMMVNYRYYLEDTEINSKQYMEDHYISISDDIKSLLNPPYNKSSL
ncbi:malonyl-CoA decarboxylase, mitochondrial isoform X2 [Parasteatoda tepidariorum]|nr:malonyl-CoA decarboxylase, mitochondrial isoform X2 [Parasteatoda tepidariorum]XP_042900725.1 malonyl-CoA decarboxylase, mitochondrial isoform X2 [Parasteatoda tepidariorum]